MHSLRTMAFLHDNLASQARMNAADPGRTEATAAEARLMDALAHVADALEDLAAEADIPQVEAVRRARAPEWSVTRHGRKKRPGGFWSGISQKGCLPTA